MPFPAATSHGNRAASRVGECHEQSASLIHAAQSIAYLSGQLNSMLESICATHTHALTIARQIEQEMDIGHPSENQRKTWCIRRRH